MTAEEIKQNNSMDSVVRRYGFKPNRAGFISCPFHNGDHTASMKIYLDSFYCFACGAAGDVFTFVQKMDNCDFKTAFLTLGGTYEHIKGNEQKHALRDAYNAKLRREKEQKRKDNLKASLPDITHRIDCYLYGKQHAEPLSDLWCFCVNELEKELYKFEEIRKEVSE